MEKLIENTKESTMSSVLLVEIINEYRKVEGNNAVLQHSDFLKKIEKELNGDEGKFSSTYLDKANRMSKCYELPKDECMLMLMSESRTVRRGVLNKINELEKQKNTIIVPSYQIEDPIARAKAWIVEKEEVLMLQEKNEKLQYRSDFLDICFDADGVFKFDEVAKILKLGYGSITLYEKMRDYGLIMKGTTIPYQKYINNGYFEVYQSLIPNGNFNKLVKVTYATSKGIGYIKKLLDQNEKK